MFYHTFLSPQMKRWAIITDKHGIYELPHELPNDLRLKISGRVKISYNDRPAPSPPAEMKVLLILA